jgi:hypothetical protein
MRMDGWANIDPSRQSVPPRYIEGNSQVDNAAPGAGDILVGSPCSTIDYPEGLPLKWASWQLTGPGIVDCALYDVTIHVYGVVECATYESVDGCSRAPNVGRDAKYDLWCPGATEPPVDPIDPDRLRHKPYVLSVTPARSGTRPNLGIMQGPKPTAGHWWMMNECPEGVTESNQTWKIDYVKTITVPGGYWINFLDVTLGCRSILNCGASDDSATTCTSHHEITHPEVIPPPPPSISTQPAAAGAGSFGQWIYFDVFGIGPSSKTRAD